MDVVMKQLRNRSGQTMVEYLMLIAVAAGTAYFIVTVGVGRYTAQWLLTIRSVINSVVRNAEVKTGGAAETGQGGHPGDPARLKPLH